MQYDVYLRPAETAIRQIHRPRHNICILVDLCVYYDCKGCYYTIV